MLKRFYYTNTIRGFVTQTPNEIIGILAQNNEFTLEETQLTAWNEQIAILKRVLANNTGKIYFEYSIPRMGKRIDAVVIIGSQLFVMEFKVGEKLFPNYAIDQVMDYALDLKNFHETSHHIDIVPILICTDVPSKFVPPMAAHQYRDRIFSPIKTNATELRSVLDYFLDKDRGIKILSDEWENGRYRPTPTIIEAAMALYKRHKVEEITKRKADATNLHQTTHTIDQIIAESKAKYQKSICFVTGVPGAGKTLVGLDIATKHNDNKKDTYSVFLSGNGPLVAVLQEALAIDRYNSALGTEKEIKKGVARSEVKAFIQNVHHFRDEGLRDMANPPVEHVTLFDEAQRAWNKEKTADFMRRKKGIANFKYSEPEFLISCMDRHKDWAVIVCLVGGGQEIHDGEAGIGEWIQSIDRSFPHWNVYISPQLTDSEYKAQEELARAKTIKKISHKNDLHLSVSMRSFRAENVSSLVKSVLDFNQLKASQALNELRTKYPILLTRDLNKAKKWVRETARGTERYGLVVSSQASRLKPLAVDVRVDIDPIHWFLDEKDDTRSSYYLEDVATEFQIQGLELDWSCVIWDADFRYNQTGWEYKSFKGNVWQNVNKPINQQYLLNAYRVLLTRARQGMVIVVPEGDKNDPTRLPEFYDPTFTYLRDIGFDVI